MKHPRRGVSSSAAPPEVRPAVLVVDDDEDTRSSLQQLLQDAGYPSAVAACGEDALELIRSGVRPSLILVDLMMPGMDGWELVGAIRGTGALAAIVSMTAGDRLMEAPVSAAYLQKPVELDELLRTVARHCGPPRRGKRTPAAPASSR